MHNLGFHGILNFRLKIKFQFRKQALPKCKRGGRNDYVIIVTTIVSLHPKLYVM
jgi:hypothetical protein